MARAPCRPHASGLGPFQHSGSNREGSLTTAGGYAEQISGWLRRRGFYRRGRDSEPAS
jgi:hypothetical protein